LPLSGSASRSALRRKNERLPCGAEKACSSWGEFADAQESWPLEIFSSRRPEFVSKSHVPIIHKLKKLNPAENRLHIINQRLKLIAPPKVKTHLTCGASCNNIPRFRRKKNLHHQHRRRQSSPIENFRQYPARCRGGCAFPEHTRRPWPTARPPLRSRGPSPTSNTSKGFRSGWQAVSLMPKPLKLALNRPPTGLTHEILGRSLFTRPSRQPSSKRAHRPIRLGIIPGGVGPSVFTGKVEGAWTSNCCRPWARPGNHPGPSRRSGFDGRWARPTASNSDKCGGGGRRMRFERPSNSFLSPRNDGALAYQGELIRQMAGRPISERSVAKAWISRPKMVVQGRVMAAGRLLMRASSAFHIHQWGPRG